MRALLPGVRPGDLQAAAYAPQVTQTGLRSPWLPPTTHLAEVTWAGLFGDRVEPVTRAEAMSVPAVARARHILCTVIGNISLHAWRGETKLTGPDAPHWIAGTDQAWSPYHRMVMTVDDLLFYGASCWSRVNDASGRWPLRMDRLPVERWTINADGQICVDALDGRGHQPVPANQVALIPGPHEGLLVFGASAIRHAKDLHRSAERAADNPTPHTELRQIAGDPLTEEQIDAVVARYHARRKMTDGAVSWLSASIESKSVGSYDAHLLVEGRNAAAVDIARAVSLPADLLDAAGEHSLTYANVRDNDKRALEYGAGMYLSAISAALSQNAVTPNGQRVAFDIESWLGQPPSATAAAAPAGTTPPRTQEDPA
jgi:hypothetical protein